MNFPPIPPLILRVLRAQHHAAHILIAINRRAIVRGPDGAKALHLLDAHTRAQREVERRFAHMRKNT